MTEAMPIMLRSLIGKYVFLFACIYPLWCAAATGDVTTRIKTPSGELAGTERNNVREFLGIPYAASPVGELRWQAPRPPDPKPVRRVDTPPNPCPQNSPSLFARPSVTEDCLYLNVFAPKLEKTNSKRLPVMVWFHGGGLFSGSSADYDGSGLAREGHVVVVTVNYRLGVLGFLYSPAVNQASGGAANYGLLDQQLALKWIHDNIAAFGGDSQSITLFGQSSGATSVIAHLISPASQGLFQRAIIQSGIRLLPLPTETARSLSDSFLKAVGCTSQPLPCLRSLPVQAILDHQKELVVQAARYFFVLDGVTLSQAPMQAFGEGVFHKVPIINGLNSDEQAFFLPELLSGTPLSQADYESWAQSTGGAYAHAILEHYPTGVYGSPSLAEIAAAQDSKRCVAMKLDSVLSKSVRVYAYEFADRKAPSYFPKRSYPMRAYHTAELQYLFPMFHGARGQTHTLDAEQDALAGTMVELWASFARNGVPIARRAMRWAPFERTRQNQLALLPEERLSLTGHQHPENAAPAIATCAMWDPINAL